MRLYPKRLHNIKDLEREKKLLLKQRRQLDKEKLPSFDDLFKGKKEGGSDSFDLSSIVEFLPVSSPLAKPIVKIIQRWASREKPPRKASANPSNKATGKSKVRAIAIDIVSSYLKWKAIEWSYKGVKYLIKKRKENA